MRKKLTYLLHAYGSIILTGIVCMVLGFGICLLTNYRDTNTLLIGLIISAIILFLLLFLYYGYEYNRIGIEKKKSTKKLKLLLLGFSFVLFCIYMMLVYPTYLCTYKENIFGIDQGQYIILLNLILYLVLTVIIYQTVSLKYSIKNIGKDGIQLERIIEDNSIEAMQACTDLMEVIYRELGELDKVVDYLYSNGFLPKDINEEDYINILQLLCQSLVDEKPNLSIHVFNLSDYTMYLKGHIGLANREIAILNYKYEEYGIIKVEHGIHIKYDFAAFHNFASKECYLIIEFNEIYDIQLGKLIYAYLKMFEALYSKYLLIEE